VEWEKLGEGGEDTYYFPEFKCLAFLQVEDVVYEKSI